jgi:serpin B
MDQTRRRLLTASGALAAAALAGCAADVDPTATPTGTPADSPTPTATEDPPTGEPTAPTDRLAELAAGNAAFALDLHRYLADAEDGNLFLSPFSVSVALAMTYGGARWETEAQMRETLHYTLGEDVHPAFADLQSELDERESTEDPQSGEEVDAFQLDVANAVWGQEGLEFAQDYLDLVDEHYGGGLRRADFAGDPDGERERINSWVAERTEDRIEDLLPQSSISPQTVLVLTNAIYFLASWDQQFDPEDTQDGTFTSLDGTESSVPMMQQGLRTDYASVPGAEAIELPYVGKDVSMVLILPDEEAFESFERDLDAETLFGIFDQLGDASGHLAMPRFEFETGVQLSEVLSELGMPVAFSGGADFGGMFEDGGGGVFIDEVYHKSFVSVDEEGTEAAAATAVVMNASAPSRSFDLSFDRPFLFCIRDRPTDAVLFLGRVTDAGEVAA